MKSETQSLKVRVDEIADAIRWPDPSFALRPWETVLGLALSDARSQPAGPMQTETVAVWLVPASVTGSHR